MDLVFTIDDPRGGDIAAVVARHLTFARAITPADHVHALDVDRLVDPAVTFFAVRRGGVVVGVGALRHLDDAHAELKSMHVTEEVRGQGVGQALVQHLLSVARARGYRRVSLETGTTPDFAPARRLYAAAGFRPCPPFAEYTVNPHSTCMTLDLTAAPIPG